MDRGLGLKPFIEWAEESLFVLHLTSQTYDPSYEQAHLDALLKRNVRCTRIVRIGKMKHPDDLDTYDWLMAFFDKDTGKPHKNYTQYHYPQDEHARLDIMIVDSTYVIQTRWAPEEGRQDMFYATNKPQYAKFRERSLNEHIKSLNLEKVETLEHFLALLEEAKPTATKSPF